MQENTAAVAGSRIGLDLIKLVACLGKPEERGPLQTALQAHLEEQYGCTRYLCIYYNTKTRTHIEFNMLPPKLHVGFPNPTQSICFRRAERRDTTLECRRGSNLACGSTDCRPYSPQYTADAVIEKVPKSLANAINHPPLDRWSQDWGTVQQGEDLPFWLKYELFLHESFDPYKNKGSPPSVAAETTLFRKMISKEGEAGVYTDGIFRGSDLWFDAEELHGFKLSVFNERNSLDTDFLGTYLIRPADTEHLEQAALLLAYGKKANFDAKSNGAAAEMLGFLSLLCWPTLVREIIRDMTTAQEAAVRNEKIAEEAKSTWETVAHLKGLEPDVRRLMREIDRLRSRAMTLQSKIFPAAAGLPARAHELMPLFGQDVEVLVRLLDDKTTPIHELGPYIRSSHPMTNFILELSDTTQDIIDERKSPGVKRLATGEYETIIQGLHVANGSGAADVAKLNRILAVAGLFGKVNNLNVLTDLSSCSISPAARFNALKIICQQFYAPKRTPDKDPADRKAFMSDLQLLATILDAVDKGAKESPKILYSLVGASPVLLAGKGVDNRLKFLEALLQLKGGPEDNWLAQNPETQQAASTGLAMTYSILPAGMRPVDILAPLFRLIKEELSGGSGGTAYLSEVDVQSAHNDLVIKLTTNPGGCIPVRKIHPKEDAMTGRHGLSRCLWELAQALGASQLERHIAPAPTSIPPEIVEPLSVWEDKYTKTSFLVHLRKVPRNEDSA